MLGTGPEGVTPSPAHLCINTRTHILSCTVVSCACIILQFVRVSVDPCFGCRETMCRFCAGQAGREGHQQRCMCYSGATLRSSEPDVHHSQLWGGLRAAVHHEIFAYDSSTHHYLHHSQHLRRSATEHGYRAVIRTTRAHQARYNWCLCFCVDT